MKAIYWDESGNEIKQTDSNFKETEWYDYENKKWANAMTEYVVHPAFRNGTINNSSDGSPCYYEKSFRAVLIAN